MNHTVDKASDPEAKSGAAIYYNGSELDMVTAEITADGATKDASYPETFTIESIVTADSITVGLVGYPNTNFTYVAIDNIKLEYLGRDRIGDVNCDGRHTMTDVVMTVNAVLERPSAKFYSSAADVNGDGIIAVGDVVNILQMVHDDFMNMAVNVRSHSRLAVEPNTLMLAAEEVTLTPGADYMVSVALKNSDAYSAFQVDIQLPEGVELVDVALSDRASESHIVAWNRLSNGKVRVLAYSADNAALSGNEGSLINLVVKTDAAMVNDAVMTITGGIFVKTNGAEQAVDDINIVMRTKTTDIENVSEGAIKVSGVAGAIIVETDAPVNVDVYTVAGQQIQSVSVVAGKSVITMPAGIYVVNNNKVIVK